MNSSMFMLLWVMGVLFVVLLALNLLRNRSGSFSGRSRSFRSRAGGRLPDEPSIKTTPFAP